MSVDNNLSKMVMQRKKLVRGLKQAARGHRAKIVAGLSADLGQGLLPGETMPDLDLLLKLVERKLDREYAALDAAENAC